MIIIVFQLRQEKAELEQTLEREQECQVSHLMKKIEKLEAELKYTEGFLKSVQGKLSNERFVNNAPEAVVASERKKEADALAKIETLKLSLTSLK